MRTAAPLTQGYVSCLAMTCLLAQQEDLKALLYEPGVVAHPWVCLPSSRLPLTVFPLAFGCHPKRGKAPNRGRCKEQSRMNDTPLPLHSGAELSIEVPKAFANSVSQELSFCCPSKALVRLWRQPTLRAQAAQSCHQPALRWRGFGVGEFSS